jgi:hypothetical protein
MLKIVALSAAHIGVAITGTLLEFNRAAKKEAHVRTGETRPRKRSCVPSAQKGKALEGSNSPLSGYQIRFDGSPPQWMDGD